MPAPSPFRRAARSLLAAAATALVLSRGRTDASVPTISRSDSIQERETVARLLIGDGVELGYAFGSHGSRESCRHLTAGTCGLERAILVRRTTWLPCRPVLSQRPGVRAPLRLQYYGAHLARLPRRPQDTYACSNRCFEPVIVVEGSAGVLNESVGLAPASGRRQNDSEGIPCRRHVSERRVFGSEVFGRLSNVLQSGAIVARA